MDDLTFKYYEQNAQEIFERYESVRSGIADYFQASFPVGSTVVDVGAGTGRDLRQLLDLGYDASGIEPCDALRKVSISAHSELQGRLLPGCMPALKLAAPVDGIVCSAVLMHLPANQLFDAMLTLRHNLKNHGRLLISIPRHRPGLDENYRDSDGRLFEPVEADRLILLCERLDLNLISRWESTDALQRKDHNWVTLLFEKGSVIGRPLDRIQSVLHKDRKVATYKLALLRGLCDLTSADDKVFDWSSPGEVGLPVDLMVERWLFYYWPVMASPAFIPQIQSEPRGKPLKFRDSLMQLVNCYRPYGGLDSFAIDYRSGKLPGEAKPLFRNTWNDIRTAIVKGPVTHAEQGGMFRYDTSTKRIYCDSTLWKEFCLTGYWIRDALILRWAELTARFGVGMKVGDVLELLLTSPEIEREVSVARECYSTQADLNCVWSGQKIASDLLLAVDHALPFSLWGNNDLWNLLPTHCQVNSKKSDKIPSTKLLSERKDAIVHNWQLLQKYEPAMFNFELDRTVGIDAKTNWETPLFDYLKRCCEYGIHVRGGDIWQGVN